MSIPNLHLSSRACYYLTMFHWPVFDSMRPTPDRDTMTEIVNAGYAIQDILKTSGSTIWCLTPEGERVRRLLAYGH